MTKFRAHSAMGIIAATVINGLQAGEQPDHSALVFKDMSALAGVVSAPTLKYGGPCVFDSQNDGRYDFVLGNHNQTPIQLFLANPDGTYTEPPAIMWLDDVHGIAAGDYDLDGDNDLMVSVGGGNGKAPKPTRLLRNDGDDFTDVTVEAGVGELGARGRSVRWIDLDLDGDLDMMQLNEAKQVMEEIPRNLLFENLGDGTFAYSENPVFENIEGVKVLVTDFNRDHKPDLITFGSRDVLALWQGDGKFGFKNVSERWLPESLRGIEDVTAVAEADIDNDGDLDYYLSRGGSASDNCDSYDAASGRLDLKTKGSKGQQGITFTTEEWRSGVNLIDFEYMSQHKFPALPVFIGAEKLEWPAPRRFVQYVGKKQAAGFPEELERNGWYLGYLGNDEWRFILNLNSNLAWHVSASIIGVDTYQSDHELGDPSRPDILIRNDGGTFTDISTALPAEVLSNNMGVVPGDFDNDSDMDFFVYRFGELKKRTHDVMLLNQGDGRFTPWMGHGATDLNEGAHGDMGCAFDYDLDGYIDLLSGNDDCGSWRLYRNEQGLAGAGKNHLLVQVGYSPKGTDPLSAELIVKSGGVKQYRLVGSGSSAFSQNLLNIVHFGLGNADKVDSVKVRWRDGTTRTLKQVDINTMVKF